MWKVAENSEIGDKNSNAKGVSPHLIKVAGNRLVFVGLAWVVSLLVTACVLPQAFGSWSETATMAAAAFLMLVFGPYLLVVGLCGGMVGDVGWGLVAMVPFVAALVDLSAVHCRRRSCYSFDSRRLEFAPVRRDAQGRCGRR